MSGNDLDQLPRHLDALIAKLSPQQRRQLARQMARTLRGMQARRIRDNIDPDGQPYAPRKPQKHLRKRRSLKLFPRIHRAKTLKANANPNAATVTFTGFANRVARVHHYGLRDRVSNKGPTIQYQERRLLGFDDQDTSMVEAAIIQHLSINT